jgi:RNA-directed DNA polymerase
MEQQVFRLQTRIAKAIKAGRCSKAKALQWILVHSFAAKYLAVLRVTQNKGKNTPGIDGICWKTPSIKYAMTKSLTRKGYKAQQLRRIYIPKKNSNKNRPLGIPTMIDRAMQELYALALWLRPSAIPTLTGLGLKEVQPMPLNSALMYCVERFRLNGYWKRI